MNVCNTSNVYNHTNIRNTNVYDNVCDTNECWIYVMNTIQINKMIQMQQNINVCDIDVCDIQICRIRMYAIQKYIIRILAIPIYRMI